MTSLDSTDRKLLQALQRDATASSHELSQTLNLAPSQIGRRKTRLEAEGFVTSYGARLSPVSLGLNVQAFVQVQTTAHKPDIHKAFLRLTEIRPEITAAWTLTGEADYLLRVFCTDLAALNTLIQEVLLPHPAVARVQSQIVMDQIKRDAPLPT